MHGSNMIDDNHQPGDRESLQHLGETTANLGCSSQTAYPTQLVVGATTKPMIKM